MGHPENQGRKAKPPANKKMGGARAHVEFLDGRASQIERVKQKSGEE
jgi:hypothetical protein